MRLTLILGAYTFDRSIEPTVAEVEDDGPGRDLGYTGGTFVGFTPHDGQDIACPQRVPAWDDEE